MSSGLEVGQRKDKNCSSGAPFTEAGLFSPSYAAGRFSSLQMKDLWVTVAHNGPLLHSRVYALMKIGHSEEDGG